MLQQTKTRVHTLFKQRLVRFLVLPLLAVVLLVYSYAGLREWAKRHADQLQVTVVQLSPDPGHSPVIYQHTFGRALAAFAENVLNNGMPGKMGHHR
jgi:hypothetical protein